MPVNFPTTAYPPRKAKTPQGPKRRNIVDTDVEKLKSDNQKGEPGVEKENVKFLFGLLEQASNERELLMKQMAEKDEIIDVISQQRDLEESSFRRILSIERKKFDKKILDARGMLRRREDLLKEWSKIGVETMSSNTAESKEYQKTVGLLKRTCKIVPDAVNASQMEQLNIWNKSDDVNEEDEEDAAQLNEEDDFYDEDIAGEQEKDFGTLDDNSIGGHTMSGSILLNESPSSKTKTKKGVDKVKAEKNLNMGSGKLDSDDINSVGGLNLNTSSKSISISELAAKEGSSQVFIDHDDVAETKIKDGDDSSHYPSVSLVSDSETKGKSRSRSRSRSKDDSVKKSVVSSSSNYEKGTKPSSKDTRKAKKKKGKKMESASLDLSNSSTKKYWWDHLVDDSSDDKALKGSNEGPRNELMLGSRLDKGGKSRISDDDDDDDGAEKKLSAAVKSPVEGEGSVVSLCSDDFNFSTTTSGV